MIATDVQDVLFGGPQAIRSQANLGVLEERQVNILVHGHEPILSEMIVAASRDADLLALARQAGAEGINIAGICCTANEILMRQGMPVAGNYLHQELALLTGAVDLMVVDVQCVMPSLPQVAACQHTKIVTTSSKAHMPAAEQMTLDEHNPKQTARAIVKSAIEAFSKRDPARVKISPIFKSYSPCCVAKASAHLARIKRSALISDRCKSVSGKNRSSSKLTCSRNRVRIASELLITSSISRFATAR